MCSFSAASAYLVAAGLGEVGSVNGDVEASYRGRCRLDSGRMRDGDGRNLYLSMVWKSGESGSGVLHPPPWGGTRHGEETGPSCEPAGETWWSTSRMSESTSGDTHDLDAPRCTGACSSATLASYYILPPQHVFSHQRRYAARHDLRFSAVL